jgi:hypothetical protein
MRLVPRSTRQNKYYSVLLGLHNLYLKRENLSGKSAYGNQFITNLREFVSTSGDQLQLISDKFDKHEMLKFFDHIYNLNLGV